MKDSDKDIVVARDKSGRRKFIRSGAAFVAAGGLIGSTQTVYADDCDREQVGEKNAEVAGTDSDSGASADPTGCGREPVKPKISQAPGGPDMNKDVKVGKFKA